MKTPFWYEEIAYLTAHPEDTRRRQEAAKLASSWQTCACGKQDPRIPRHEDGSPANVRLWMLGLEFFRSLGGYSAVHLADFSQCDYPKALEILDQIEKRAAEILGGLE